MTELFGVPLEFLFGGIMVLFLAALAATAGKRW